MTHMPAGSGCPTAGVVVAWGREGGILPCRRPATFGPATESLEMAPLYRGGEAPESRQHA